LQPCSLPLAASAVSIPMMAGLPRKTPLFARTHSGVGSRMRTAVPELAAIVQPGTTLREGVLSRRMVIEFPEGASALAEALASRRPR
jgi:hypothetical protein